MKNTQALVATPQKAITKIDTKSLIVGREELMEQVAALNERLTSLNQELLIRASKEDNKKLIVDDKTVTVVKRLSFKDVSLDFAKRFRAVKKVVDPSVLKPLYEKGVKMEGVTYSEYVLVK